MKFYLSSVLSLLCCWILILFVAVVMILFCTQVFSESRIVEYSVKEKLISPGKHEVHDLVQALLCSSHINLLMFIV